MSASLVGSEMCIRDRAGSAGSGRAVLAPATDSQAGTTAAPKARSRPARRTDATSAGVDGG
eukprot:9746676-Alexandrium_andersonii.AAC.1